MSETITIDKDLLENKYSQKIQPLFELKYKNLIYKEERMDYSPFGFEKEDIDELIALALDRSEDEVDYDKYQGEVNRFFPATLHALVILGHMGVAKAVDPLLKRLYADAFNNNFHELFPEFLGNIGEDAIGTIKEHLNEKQNGDKFTLFEGITEIIIKHPNTKDELSEMLMDYIQFTDDNSNHLGSAIASLIDFSGDTHIDFMRDMFKTREVSVDWVGDIENIEMDLGLREERNTPQPKNSLQEAFDNAMKSKNISKPQTTEVKVGRNEPCPCGSGKKYKKCCLNK